MSDRLDGTAAVSFDDEPLILVDEQDRETGHLDKLSCHLGDGRLHRAFSVFLFDHEGRVLLQQRSRHKLLWPLYWSNSCCSHPRRGETMRAAVSRRLREELGVEAELHYLYTFRYAARYHDVGTERECCSVFLGRTAQRPRPHPEEIQAVRWLSAGALDAELRDNPQAFTPWSIMEWRRIRAEPPPVVDIEEYPT